MLDSERKERLQKIIFDLEELSQWLRQIKDREIADGLKTQLVSELQNVGSLLLRTASAI